EFATGSAGSANYSTNWRPYTSGQTLSGFNTIIDPTSASSSARYNTSFGGQSGLMPAIASNSYYTFIVGTNSASNNTMSVLETNYNPVSISSVAQSPTSASVYATQSVTVTATMASSLNSGEGVYLRYSTNGFSSSTVVAMTNTSGNDYTASIPAQTNGISVQYYVFTSNISSSTVTSNPGNADFYSLHIRTSGGLNVGGSNYSYTVQQWQTVSGATTWSSGTSWNAGIIPPSGVNVNIANNLTLDQDATVAALTISGGAVLAGGSNVLSITGDVTISSGSISSSGSGRVEFTGTSAQSVGAGTFGNMRCNKSSGTVSIAAVTCTGLEITSGTMQLTGSSAFTVNGDVLINGGTFALSSSSGGDLSLTGNWTRSSGSFTANNRAIFFTGTNNQTINGSGGATIPYLLINKSSGTVSLGSNLSLTAPLGGNAFDIGGPTLDLNGFSLSITNNINVGGTGVNRSIVNTGAATTITTSGTTISRGSTATLGFGTNITLQTSNGIDFGAGITTINGTFRLNAGGFISNNNPAWGSNSTYNLNIGGDYAINGTTLGWTSSLTPPNVLISNPGTVAQINQSRSVSASGTMIVEAGCAITVGSGATLTTNGNLTLSSNASGTARIGNSAGSISGELTVERYIPGGSSRRRTRLISSPVVGGTAAQWRNNGTNTAGQGIQITGTGGAGNGFDASNNSNNPASAWSYDPSFASASSNSNGADWVPFTSGSMSLTNGRGYRVLVRGDRTNDLSTQNTTTSNTTI
ncbi:MAG: beta strand repeat-containing protein, partial [Dolichospermum sp.]